jgi:hypothetical protein
MGAGSWRPTTRQLQHVAWQGAAGPWQVTQMPYIVGAELSSSVAGTAMRPASGTSIGRRVPAMVERL